MVQMTYLPQKYDVMEKYFPEISIRKILNKSKKPTSKKNKARGYLQNIQSLFLLLYVETIDTKEFDFNSDLFFFILLMSELLN